MLNRTSFFKQTIIFFISIIFCIILFSCKNFLNAGKVSEEIKDSIAYNNAKTVEITISCKEDQGTIYPQQSYKAKLGYDFEIQFIPNTENYVLKNPEAIFEAVNKLDTTQSRADCIEFTNLERSIEDIKAGLYRIKAKVIKDASDIMIRPCLTTLPAVVDIYPPYVPSGYNQDTTVKITFSKPMNVESFGNFDCIFMTSENVSVKDNYDKPYFSNDNTVLNIPTAKGMRLIPKDTVGTKQITISISTEELKDFEDLSISKNISHSFCVNQEMDRKPPVIESAGLKKTDNSEINNLDFEQWGDNDSIFSQNHLKNSFSFCVQGYDLDSGIGGLRITETLYRLSNGDIVSNAISETSYYEQTTFLADNSDYSVYEISGNHNIKSINNGVIKIDLQLIDKSDNPSAAKTFYIINDTQIDASLIKFEEFEDIKAYKLDSETEEFTMTLKNELKDYYYKNHFSDFNITIKWGYKDDELTNIAQRDGQTFSFTRNTELLTYLEISCSDILGNKKTISKVIPPKLCFDSSCLEKSGYNRNITPFSYDSLKQIVDFNDAELLMYYVQNVNLTNITKINLSVKSVLYNKETFEYTPDSYIGNDKKYSFFFFYVIKYTDNTYFSSPISNNYMNVQSYGGGTQILEINQTSVSTEPAPAPEVLLLTCEPVTNSGCYKIDIDTDNLDPDYNWTYCFKNTSTGKIQSFNINTFYINSSAKYTLSLVAKNSEGLLYKKENQKMQLSGEEPVTELNLSADTTPPTFSIYAKKDFLITPKGVLLFSEPKDSNSGLYTDPQDNSYSEITYYFLPNPGIHVCDFTYYDLDELKDYQIYAKTLKYKIGSKQLFIPFEDISEAFYTLCMVVKDKAGNSTVECMPVLYKLLKKTVPTTLKSNGNNSVKDYTLTSTFDSQEEAKRFCHGILVSDNQAIVLKEAGSSTNTKNELTTSFNINSSDTSNIGKVCKFVIGTKYTDENVLVDDAGIYDLYYSLENTQNSVAGKSMWECVNGYQISIQSSTKVHIHTLYSKRNLSENAETKDDAINMWLRKGLETGIKTITASQIYEQSNWDAVPKDYYYVIIVHFTDGVRFMTEVKQKHY